MSTDIKEFSSRLGYGVTVRSHLDEYDCDELQVLWWSNAEPRVLGYSRCLCANGSPTEYVQHDLIQDIEERYLNDEEPDMRRAAKKEEV